MQKTPPTEGRRLQADLDLDNASGERVHGSDILSDHVRGRLAAHRNRSLESSYLLNCSLISSETYHARLHRTIQQFHIWRLSLCLPLCGKIFAGAAGGGCVAGKMVFFLGQNLFNVCTVIRTLSSILHRVSVSDELSSNSFVNVDISLNVDVSDQFCSISCSSSSVKPILLDINKEQLRK